MSKHLAVIGDILIEESSKCLKRDCMRVQQPPMVGKHTRVFTDSVRKCKRVFELVLADFLGLTATPTANPLAKQSSGLAFP